MARICVFADEFGNFDFSLGDAGISCFPTLGDVLIIFPYLLYSYITMST